VQCKSSVFFEFTTRQAFEVGLSLFLSVGLNNNNIFNAFNVFTISNMSSIVSKKIAAKRLLFQEKQ